MALERAQLAPRCRTKVSASRPCRGKHAKFAIGGEGHGLDRTVMAQLCHDTGWKDLSRLGRRWRLLRLGHGRHCGCEHEGEREGGSPPRRPKLQGQGHAGFPPAVIQPKTVRCMEDMVPFRRLWDKTVADTLASPFGRATGVNGYRRFQRPGALPGDIAARPSGTAMFVTLLAAWLVSGFHNFFGRFVDGLLTHLFDNLFSEYAMGGVVSRAMGEHFLERQLTCDLRQKKR